MNRNMAMKLLISDLDGTILETEDYHRLAYNALFKELGLKQVWSKKDYVDRLQTMGGNKFREVFSWLNLPEEKFKETKRNLYLRKTELYVELITRDLRSGNLELRSGIVRLFDEARNLGLPVAIGTACVGWAAEKVVEAALGKEFLQSLTCLCGGESVERQKPAPDVYLLVAEKASVNPQHCVVLEDTGHGLEAAKNAGMVCVVSPSEFAKGHDFSKSDLTVPDWSGPPVVNLDLLQRLLL